MQFKRIKTFDNNALGTLNAALLASQTSGSFQLNGASALGSQLASIASGQYFIVSIENEEILCSALTVVSTTVTCVIATGGRGYNSTSAVDHIIATAAECHWTSGHGEEHNAHLARFDDDGLILPITTPFTITNATTLSVAALDATAYYTPGRAIVYEVANVWYRAVVVSSSFSTNTTVTVNGDGLPASGTVQYAGFDMTNNAKSPLDLILMNEIAGSKPATNPPSGYSWLFAKSGSWYAIDSTGAVRFITAVRASVSSSGGVLTLDCSTASVFDVTLTENITGVTWSNGVEGHRYTLRITQHASVAKTVVLGTGGGTRFSNTIASYVMTTDLSAVDELQFQYTATGTKWDIIGAAQGFQASPGATSPVLVKVGSFTPSAGTGNKSVTGVGFKGKMVRFHVPVTGGSGSATWGGIATGAATSSAARWATYTVTGYDNRVTGKNASTSLCLEVPTSGTSGTSDVYTADFVSMDSDGFTINCTLATTVPTIYYEVIG